VNLRQKQSAFAHALATLILWIEEQGWEVTLAEGFVGTTDAADGDYDGPHMKNGQHYNQLGQDLNLFIHGDHITNGEHPAWLAIGARWKQIDSMARWGGDFGDANHFSFEHEGRK
jgi:hypothetical protein